MGIVKAGWMGVMVAGLAAAGMGAKPHKSDLTGTSWRLVEFKGSDGLVLKPKDKNKYTVVFGDGGRLSAVVDCNQGHGSWDSDGPGHLTFGALGLTRMMCPEEGAKLDGNLETQWENVTSYVLKGGRLFLSLKTDAGTYEFEQVKGARGGAVVASPDAALTDFDSRISFDVFLAIATEVGDSAGTEIHVIANNSRTPTCLEKLGKCAFSGLIDSQRCDQSIPVECWYVQSTRYQGYALHHDRPLAGEKQALTRG
jgi:heat shock protein HslJ